MGKYIYIVINSLLYVGTYALSKISSMTIELLFSLIDLIQSESPDLLKCNIPNKLELSLKTV